ncbi:LamG domain-containing protein [Lentzea sp. NPDC004782]|uniref:LamG domain-containing protein n=1 Tax=Lentzea sp. NPDC004782 TaxID=3154458 RepID=UPI0033A189F4
MFAKQGNKSVRVTSLTTETDEVSAQPDGSFQLRSYVRPVRVKRGDHWIDVDTTLERHADGTIGPKASTVDVTFSGGGQGSKARGPLVKIGSGDTEVGLAWESDLPAPVLDGASATYPEVWPGVDLKVTADTLGFSELLVVKTPEASRNPKLAKVAFGSYTRKTQVRPGQNKVSAKSAQVSTNGLDVVDGSGKTVFTGDASHMWDAAGKQATMTTEVSGDTISVTPDPALLLGKDTKFPVSIDPEYYCSNTSWCGQQHHVVTQSGYPSARNYDATGGDLGDLKAGYENYDKAGTSHSYVQMNSAPVIGKIIHWARFDAPVLHTASCSPAATELWRTDAIGGGTTWGAQPVLRDWVGSSNVANCKDAGGVTMSVTATDIVRRAAGEGWQNITFGLKGTDDDESHQRTSSWRRFGLNTYLEVNYDSVPDNPSGHAMQNGTVPCVKGANRPWVDTRTPQVSAWVSDPDGGTLWAEVATSGGPYGADVPNTYRDNNANRPAFASGSTAQYWIPDGWITKDGLWKWAIRVGDGEVDSPRWDWDCEFYVDTVVPNAPTVALTGAQPQIQGDMASFSVAVPLATPGLDDIDHFVYSTDGSDPAVQGSPTIARDAALDANGNVTAKLTATAANGNQNIIRVKAVNRTGKPGPNANCVAGNGLDAASCSYVVQPLTPEKGLMGAWAIDETYGTSTSDSVAALRPGATPHPAALNGDAWWALGYSRGNGWTQPDAANAKDGVKGGMHFSANGYLAANGPVIDTTKSFTMSAWAMIADTSPDAYHAVIAQDGNVNSGAFIEYSSDAKTWTFNLPATDATSPDNPRVVARSAPALNVWTHLTGTYDAPSGTATLYVNGVKQNSLVRKGFATNGPLTVGGLKWNSQRTAFFNGFIDDAQVWQRALSPDEVHALATASVSRAQYGLAEGAAAVLATGSSGNRLPDDNFVPAPVPALNGYWKLDESSGNTAADAGNQAQDNGNHGNGYTPRPATFTGGSTWTAGKVGNSVHLDGTGYGQTTGDVVDTSRSFTVSAYVKLDDLNGYYGVMGQSDPNTHVPGFMMRYSADVKAWIFGVNSDSADKTAAHMNWAYVSDNSAKSGVWQLVTGVFNTETNRIEIYVDGRFAGRSAFPAAPWNVGGVFTIGAYDVGGITHQLKGSVDQVQVWQQALTASQIAGMAGLSYQDATWNLNGQPAVTPAGNVAETAVAGSSANAQFTWDGTVTAGRPDSFRTDQSFTAEAWVKLDATDDTTRGAVSVDDTASPPFELGFRKDDQPEGKWNFGFSCSASSPCLKIAYSDAKAERGKWTHLTGVYDATTSTACLYVNAVRQSTCLTGVTGLNSTGLLRLGKMKWNGSLTDFWHGGIAGVRLYSGVRTPDEIKGDRTADDPGRLFGVVH